MGGDPLEVGARTPTYLALSPEVERVTGKYFDDCQAVPSSDSFALVAAVLALVLVICRMNAVAADAETNYCDPGLSGSSTHPYGYRNRGDRCEGVYFQDVAATLRVVSFTNSLAHINIESNEDIDLRWTPASDNDVHLRAEGLRHRLYFRMDTIRLPAPGVYRWPSALLSALDIAPASLGVIGWTREAFGDTQRDVYLPLHISQDGTQAQSPDYELMLLPGRDVSEIFVTLARADVTGEPDVFLREGEPLGYGGYPAGLALPIRVRASGRYRPVYSRDRSDIDRRRSISSAALVLSFED